VTRADGGDLQKYVDSKAEGFKRYTRAFDARLLLLVAGGNAPGAHLDLEDGTFVDTRGFDAVFFQKALAWTLCIGGRYRPLESAPT